MSLPRIALVTHDLSQGGGVGTMTEFLHRVLCESGRYEPQIISLAMSAADGSSTQLRTPRTWSRGIQVTQERWRGLRYLHVGASATELEHQRYRPRKVLTEILQNYDLIQFVVGSPPYAWVAADTDRPKLIWTATTTRADRRTQIDRGSLARRAWSSLMVPITEGYERRALQTADTVFALSEYTRNAVAPLVRNGAVVLAPCGVDTNLFRPAPADRGDYILCVARLSDPRKNVDLLLSAYALLLERTTAVPDLYLIGERPSELSQKRLAELGLAEKVRLLGPKQGAELAQLYREARFFVLSSNEEGLAIVILEAMASGLAVVSTDCGGPATAIEPAKTGLLTPVGDAAALAAAMENLVRDASLCERMGQAGREVVEQRFSLSAAGRVFLDTYGKN
jgi:D-inositol-3-phosphate glycosyltransferase